MMVFNLWWKRQPNHVAVDSKSILEDVILTTDHPYGDAEYETMDEIMPAQPSGALPPVLYAHGGGFVAVSSMLLNASLTPIARAGARVFSMDYPLAPEYPWPAAALSTLRAMRYVRKCTGADRIALAGDSAGANLIAYAAALLSDRRMLAALAAHTGEELLEWDLPAVSSVCSIYGFLDDESWRATYLSPGLDYCWRSYFAATAVEPEGSERSDARTTPRVRVRAPVARHLLEFAPSQLEGFPPTLLIGATGDPLVGSTRCAAAFLRAAGVAVEVEEFDAPHGFLGVPPQWSLGFWRHTSAPAMEKIVRFLTSIAVRYPRDTLPWDWSAWLVLVPLVSVQLELCCLAVGIGSTLAKRTCRLATEAVHRLRKRKTAP